MENMEILKQINWHARGSKCVKWQIVTLPESMEEKDYISFLESNGWEVIGRIIDYELGEHNLYIERDASIKPDNISVNKTDIIADSNDSCIISGLPVNCIIRINDKVYECEDTVFEFTVDMPGVYQVMCEKFPDFYYAFEVTAHEGIL